MNVNPFSYLIEKLKGKVDKSGDTMTGTLNIEATNDTPLTLKRTNSSSSVMMNFYNQNGIVGGYVAGNDGKPYYRKSDGTYPQIALTSDIYKYNVLATANANQTYATQLGQLQSTYNNLSIDYKNRVVIKRGGRIYYQGNTDKGEFTCQYATSALNVLTFNITDKTYKAFDGTNVVDYSSINNNAALELALI